MANNSRYNHQSLIGQHFGTLEVIGVGSTILVGTRNRPRKNLIVQCTIHKNIPPYEVIKQSLTNGLTTGCPECKRLKYITHGKSHTKTYRVYKRILQRILDPNDMDYNDYGGRGIDMDPRYNPSNNNQGLQAAFENFYNDIGNIPNHLQLDREDNSKGYWKNNLRLVTVTEQQQNKRNNVVDENIVRQLRSDYDTGNYSCAELGRKYNLKPHEARRIAKRILWKNIK